MLSAWATRPIDPDAKAWGAAVTAASGTFSTATLRALSTYIAGMKAAGLWSKLAVFNPMCGNQLAAALIQYKRSTGAWAAATNNGPFVSGDYTEATGLAGTNASAKYLDTGVAPTAVLTLNNSHIAIYQRKATSVTSNASAGAHSAAAQTMALWTPQTDTKAYADHYDTAAEIASTANAEQRGLWTSSVTASGAGGHNLYQNATSKGTGTAQGTRPGANFLLFTRDGISMSDPILAAYSMGDGLTAGEVSSYYTLTQAFQTALGRNV